MALKICQSYTNIYLHTRLLLRCEVAAHLRLCGSIPILHHHPRTGEQTLLELRTFKTSLIPSQPRYHLNSAPLTSILDPKITRAGNVFAITDDIFSFPAPELSADQWTQIGIEFQEKVNRNKQWPSQMMSILAGQTSFRSVLHVYTVAKSLLKYVRDSDLKRENSRPLTTIPLLINFMKICGVYNTSHECDRTNMEAVIKELYDEVYSKTDILDPQSNVDMIKVLTSTNKYWELTLPILEEVKLLGRPSALHYCPIVNAAFRNDLKDKSWELLVEMAETFHEDSYLHPNENFYWSFLRDVNSDDMNDMNMLLGFMEKYKWIPTAEVAKKFIEFYQNAGWTGKTTQVSPDGTCSICREQLARESLSTDEFTELRTAFMEKCIRREDVFLNTSPQEIKGFQKFLDRHDGFDIVLDGLNIGLQLSKGKGNRKPSTQLLKIAQLLSQHGRLLVCGRKHMKKWPAADMRHLEQIATLFYAEDGSSDDPFMIYAALHSGEKTKLVTVDLLRDHRHLLPPQLRESFKTWQRTHIITFSFNKGLHLTWPTHINTRAQHSGRTIHIPYEDGIERASHELPNAWICLKK